MKITIKNFRGVESAEFPIDGVSLIAGINCAGKSSVCMAVAAALAGDPLPLPQVTKRDAGLFIRAGTDQAMVQVETEEGTVKLSYPAAERTTEGKLSASRIASGLDRFVSFDRKERSKLLSDLLQADPTENDLRESLAEIKLPDAVISKIWEAIGQKGWDDAHLTAKERGAKLKGMWEQITAGERYGSHKASSWTPAAWEENLAGASEQTLGGDVQTAKQELEECIASAAIGRDEIKRLEETVRKGDEALVNIVEPRARAKSLTAELEKAQAHRRSLPSPETTGGVPCPHCGKPIRIRAGKLEAADTKLSEDELKQRKVNITQADDTITRINTELQGFKSRVSSIEADMLAVPSAKDRLKTAKKGGVDSGQVEDARNAVAKAERRVEAWKAKTEADRHHQSILANQVIVGALSATGVRRTCVARALEHFNKEHLNPLSSAASWKDIEIDSDMEIRYAGRRYGLLSTSEQYRVKAIVHTAIAKLDGSALIILDGADVLYSKARGELVAMLSKADIPSLVAMTIANRQTAPQLRTLGIGHSYWIEAGVVSDLTAEKTAA